MISNIRFSRISHPRATVWSLALLVIFFLGFGVWVEACTPETTALPTARAFEQYEQVMRGVGL